MAGVQNVDLGIRNVAGIGQSSRHREGRIVAAPQDERRRLVGSQPVLPLGIGGDVGAVVVEQVGLDLALSRTRQEGVLVRPAVRIIPIDMRAVADVTPPCALERGEGVDLIAMRRKVYS